MNEYIIDHSKDNTPHLDSDETSFTLDGDEFTFTREIDDIDDYDLGADAQRLSQDFANGIYLATLGDDLEHRFLQNKSKLNYSGNKGDNLLNRPETLEWTQDPIRKRLLSKKLLENLIPEERKVAEIALNFRTSFDTFIAMAKCAPQ